MIMSENPIEADKELTKEWLEETQKLIDEIAKNPKFRQFVVKHKLSILDDNLKMYDVLLDKGILKTPKE